MNKSHSISMLLVRYILVGFCVLSIISCNTEDFLDYLSEENEQELYVSGFVCNDSIYVCLAYTQPNIYRSIYDPEEYTPTITDSTAIITIYEDDVFFCTLDSKTIIEHDYSNDRTFERLKHYYVSYIPVAPNSEYKIRIEHDKFGTIEASTVMPQNSIVNTTRTQVERITRFYYDEDYGDSGIWVDSFVWNDDFSVELNTSLNVKNYSMFDFQLFCRGFNLKQRSAYKPNINDNSRPTGNYTHANEYNLDDKYNIEFSYCSDCDGTRIFNFYQISEEYYSYQQSINAYNTAKTDPFSKPVTIYSNMSNGMGVWYAYFYEPINLAEVK